MKLEKYEMPTIIAFTEDATLEAQICTYNAHLKERLEKLAAEHPEEVKLHPRQYQDGSARYIVPQRWLLTAICKISAPKAPSAATLDALAKGRAIRAAQRAAEEKG